MNVDLTVAVILVVFFGILVTFVAASIRHIPRKAWATFILLVLVSTFAFVIAIAFF